MNRCEEVCRTWKHENSGGQAIIRRGLQTFIVLKTHRAAFEEELGIGYTLGELTRVNYQRPWLQRLVRAAQVYDLSCDLHRRVKGDKEARRLARGSVARFLTPRWPWLIRRLTNPQKNVNEGQTA